jgi:hypothetical protein
MSGDKEDIEIESLITKISLFFNKLDTNTTLIILFFAGAFALVMGSINEGLISDTSLLLTVLVGFGVYYYVKKQYTKELNKYRLKDKSLKEINLLDDLCSNRETRNAELCNKYEDGKTNFKTINEMLLKQYRTVIKDI